MTVNKKHTYNVKIAIEGLKKTIARGGSVELGLAHAFAKAKATAVQVAVGKLRKACEL